MIKSIHIQNFRCFEDLKLNGFGRVNLIGGLNNSGKTVLLEGIYMGVSQNPQTLIDLKEARYNNANIWKTAYRETAWNDLFYNQEKTRKVTIESTLGKKARKNTVIEFIDNPYQRNQELLVAYQHNEKLFSKGKIILNEDNSIEGKSISFKDEFRELDESLTIYYFLSKSLTKNLVSLYSKLEIAGNSDIVLEGIQVIDKSIIDLKIVSLSRPALYVKRENEPLTAIQLLGDAIQKLATITILMLESQNGILLIDEIENGIHYANQPKVWELIFKLARKFNVQIFATSHSKEMTEAFCKAADSYGKEEARYIEMARHHKTSQVVGLVTDIDMLEYKLENNKAFRGE